MANPISLLKETVKDPVELTSITFPSAALVASLFAYKEHIHPALNNLPNPLTGNAYGVLLFVVVTLALSVLLKRVSHDFLNWIYDRVYRDRRRGKEPDTWYRRVVNASPPHGDPKQNNYREAYDELKRNQDPVVPKVDLEQTYSKLARSISLILLLLAVVLVANSNFVLGGVCMLLSLYMFYTFCKMRWEASELLYEAKHQGMLAHKSS